LIETDFPKKQGDIGRKKQKTVLLYCVLGYCGVFGTHFSKIIH
jgi:hypothetical protein